MAQLHERGTKEHCLLGPNKTPCIPILALSSIYTEPRTNETRVEHVNVRISKWVKLKQTPRVGYSSSVMNTLCPLYEMTIITESHCVSPSAQLSYSESAARAVPIRTSTGDDTTSKGPIQQYHVSSAFPRRWRAQSGASPFLKR
jgi:hypothetical protein